MIHVAHSKAGQACLHAKNNKLTCTAGPSLGSPAYAQTAYTAMQV